MTLAQIKDALGEIDLASCNTLLNGCEVIKDVPLFISSHISYLEANPKNKAFMPYYHRLLKFVKCNI